MFVPERNVRHGQRGCNECRRTRGTLRKHPCRADGQVLDRVGDKWSMLIIAVLEDGIENGWSDWLQLRLAEVSSEAEVASWLHEKGRTKRIRRTAQERLRRL